MKHSIETQNENQSSSTKKKFPTIVAFGIGCFLILAFSFLAFGVVFAVGGKFLFSSFGQNLFKKAIEDKVGVKVENDKNGDAFSITNQKTGESVQLGNAQIPSNFPKDFPLYPGATPGGSAVGSENTIGKGFWLLLQSSDSLSKVIAFYDDQLEAKGWTIEENTVIGEGSTYKVKKEKLIGTIIISTDKKSAKTTILITLEPTNEQNPAPQEVAPEGAEPVEEL